MTMQYPSFGRSLLYILCAAAIALIIMVVITSQPIAANADNITVHEAYERVKRGEIVLVDIRRPQEWHQSGIASVAKPITMYQPRPAFVAALKAAMGDASDKPIALICATGGRTRHLQRQFKQLEGKNIINVLGGMFGTARHEGWIKARLPVEQWQSASD